jgi:hypothetical protein
MNVEVSLGKNKEMQIDDGTPRSIESQETNFTRAQEHHDTLMNKK